MPVMGWEDDEAQRERDAVYGLELVPDSDDDAGIHGNPAVAVEQRETLANDSVRRIPRVLRIVGALAAAAALTVAVWPSSGSKPAPAPLRIHLAGATLKPSGRITTLTLLLANDATSSASVDEADIQDADGRRLGTDRRWPAGDIPAGSTLAVDIAVPYVCDTHSPQRVPVRLHVSVSSPLLPSAPRELSYPVDPATWQEFEHFQAGVCDSAPSAVEVGPVSIAGAQPANHSVRILTAISVGEPLTLDGVFALNPAFQVTADPQAPYTVPATGWQPIATTWRVPDCASMTGHWDARQALVLAYEGPTGGTSLIVPLPPNVVSQLAAIACPS